MKLWWQWWQWSWKLWQWRWWGWREAGWSNDGNVGNDGKLSKLWKVIMMRMNRMKERRGWQAVLPMSTPDLPTPPHPLCQEFGLMMMINMNMTIISILIQIMMMIFNDPAMGRWKSCLYKSDFYAQTTSNKSVTHIWHLGHFGQTMYIAHCPIFEETSTCTIQPPKSTQW